jgi:hypothetical protein
MDRRVFLPGSGKIPELPLGRYLPPLPEGILSAWLSEQEIPRGSWVLDPLGSTPQVPLEAASSGYKVFCTCNNPVLALMLQVLADAPDRAYFQAVISDLADSRRAGERLEFHLNTLYQTVCPACKKIIQADTYLWRKGEDAPYSRVLDCPHCHTSGEFPLENEDHEALQRPGNLGLLRSRALERIGIPYAADNPVIRDVLECYPDRAFYALFNLINRIEALPVEEEKRRLLQALLLSACDAGTDLWPQPATRTRPRLINPPGEFREVNLWKAFQDAVENWVIQPERIELTIFPEMPGAQSGICLFPGRLASLSDFPPNVKSESALGVVPYPNQAFWSFSAVWSGWIWGKETASALHGVLGRQRFDSRWVGAVLTGSFSRLPKGIPFHAEIPEVTPGLLTATLAAGLAGGLRLEGIACEQESSLAQVTWESGHPNEVPLPGSISRFQRDTMTDALMERGEPATYLQLAGTGMERLIRMKLLPSGNPRSYDELLNRLQQAQKENFEDATFFKVYGSRAADSQGLWWLQKLETSPLSLADRLEGAILEQLKGKKAISIRELQGNLYESFPGFLTPTPGLIQMILDSYFISDPDQLAFLNADPEKLPGKFQEAIPEIELLLEKVAKALGLTTVLEPAITWRMDGKTLYRVFIACDGCLSPWVDQFREGHAANIILCPEARHELIFFKIARDPRLLEALGSWRLIGFEQLGRIAANNDPQWAFRDAMSDPGKTPDGQAAQISFLS